MKGILFGGCSYTWGQGLYYYSDLPNLYNPENIYIYPGHKVTPAQIRFKNTLYYPRLVANHFNTFELVKYSNGGTDDETFLFFKQCFSEVDNLFGLQPKHSENYTYDEFDYIVIQLSGTFRSKFYFNIDDIEFSCKLDTYIMDYNLVKYMKQYNFTIEEIHTQFINQQYQRLKKELLFYESKGIKTKILVWFDDLLDYINNDSFFHNKVVKLYYDNKVIDTIKELQDNYDEMKIVTDPYFKNKKFNDYHPSKLLHQIMADGIIKSIESDIV